MKATTQFKELKTPSGKRAFEAYVAVYANDGAHVVIAAPTLDALEVAYEKLTGQQLVKEKAQHCFIVQFKDGVK